MSDEKIDRGIASLVDITDSLLRGEFDKDAVSIDAEGLLKELANKINKMVINMKSIEVPLVSAGEQAPDMVDRAVNVVDLMKKTAGEVLDKSDKLADLADQVEDNFQRLETVDPALKRGIQNDIDTMKNDIFDIIATQTFQDVARQKMEVIIKDLNKMRDWLIEALLVLNIRGDHSPENVLEKTEILRDVAKFGANEEDKQNLVDDLLAEFGF